MGKSNNGDVHDEAELYAYWLEIGGAEGWHTHTTGEQLSKKLAECKIEKANPAVKDGNWVHAVTKVDEKELQAYIAVILSRLPKLRKIRIYGASANPFNFEAISEVENAFPVLEHVGLIRSAWDEDMLTELEDHLPHLKERAKLLSRGCGIGLYRENGPSSNPEEVKEIVSRHKKADFLD